MTYYCNRVLCQLRGESDDDVSTLRQDVAPSTAYALSKEDLLSAHAFRLHDTLPPTICYASQQR
jgi:hypothetical protein